MIKIDYFPQTISAEELRTAVEFDAPFIVNKDRTVELSGNFGPDEVFIGRYSMDTELSKGWKFFTDGNHTGYSGPVMNESAQLSGKLAEEILDSPGEYCVVIVNISEDEDDEEFYHYVSDEIAGWAVVKAV